MDFAAVDPIISLFSANNDSISGVDSVSFALRGGVFSLFGSKTPPLPYPGGRILVFEGNLPLFLAFLALVCNLLRFFGSPGESGPCLGLFVPDVPEVIAPSALTTLHAFSKIVMPTPSIICVNHVFTLVSCSHTLQ